MTDLTPERLAEIERNLDDRLRSETTLTGREMMSTMATHDLRNIVRMARRTLELERERSGLALRTRFDQDDALWEPPTPADLGPRAAGSPDEPSA